MKRLLTASILILLVGLVIHAGEKKPPKGDKTGQVEVSAKVKKNFGKRFDKALKAKGDKARIKKLTSLAKWAARKKYAEGENKAYLKIVDIDPDNKAARGALGHKKVCGEWLSGEEAELANKKITSSGGKGGKAGRHEDEQVDLGDKKRPYLLHVPGKCVSGKPVPLLLYLHGDRGSRKGQCIVLWKPLAEKEGFIYAAGEGQRGGWPGSCGRKGCEDDRYVLAVIKDIKKKYNINCMRIFIVGQSKGASFISRFNRLYGTPVAAAAMLNGVVMMGGGGFAKRKTPFFIFHGEKDFLQEKYGARVERLRKAGHEVEYKVGKGMGHTYNKKTLRMLWDFFKGHRMPVKYLEDKKTWK